MADLVGSTLGAHHILGQIGAGGMATVYKAYHPGMDRLVALKILPHQYAQDPHFVERFKREARIIAKLEHRNIIPVHDFGEQDGVTYLTMRYLQAGTVKEILERGPLPLADAARILNDVAAALDHAHAHGIIHRDVKPANVLVDKEGSAFLTDFGIAKVLEGTSNLTGSAMLGTPTYMAPEQTLSRPVTPQTDVYSLGVMLYEMVTGKPPFEGDTPIAVALMHVNDPLPPPREVNPALSEEVERVLMKALAKETDERYQTAGELARDFEEVVRAGEEAASTRLIELAGEAAEGKGSAEVTQEIRAEIRRRETGERRKRILRWVPWVVGALIVIGLGVGLFQAWAETEQVRSESEQTATAVADLLNQLSVAQTAAAGGGGPGAQATLQALQTQVVVFGLAATATATNTHTPTATFTSTPTARPTNTMTATFIPSRTSTIVPSETATSTGVSPFLSGTGTELPPTKIAPQVVDAVEGVTVLDDQPQSLTIAVNYVVVNAPWARTRFFVTGVNNEGKPTKFESNEAKFTAGRGVISLTLTIPCPNPGFQSTSITVYLEGGNDPNFSGNRFQLYSTFDLSKVWEGCQ